jgi:O-antigen/teichoic acid export membrane protein
LREHAARGSVVNAVFLIALSSLGLVRGFVLAGLLSPSDYGVWGLLVVTLSTVLFLKQAGIGDKFVQQDEPDQELAFQKAFTLELAFTGAWTLLFAAAVPLVVLVYGEPKLLVPGLVLVLILPAGALQAPLWIHYRRMDFARQRVIQAIDPILGLVVTLALAIAGAGYWALIAGLLVGAWTTAAVAVWTSPVALRLRYDRGAMRTYASFSWPLVVAGAASAVIAQSAIISTDAKLGLAGAGVITLAATISQYTERVDTIVTGTLYPAICAVQERTALLHESFVKSNRLALIWAMPFGVGLTLFAPDLVHFVIGERWRPAVVVLQVYGLTAAIGHIGFNWDSYFRARADSRPIAVAGVLTMVAFLATGLPLLFAYGLPGLAAGVAIQALVNLIVRLWYLRRLFRGFAIARHAARAVAPALPAAALILLARPLESGSRTALVAAAELLAFGLTSAGMTLLLEGRLLREAVGYLRARSVPQDAPGAVGA